MRLQLIGPMSGLPAYNYPAFNAAAADLRAAGHEVWNPAETDGDSRARPRTWYMRRSLAALQAADIAVLLPGWERSQGARLEVEMALAIGLPVVPLAAMRQQLATRCRLVVEEHEISR